MAKPTFRDLILFEDEDFICINKPSSISSLQDRQDEQNILKMSKGYSPNAKLCHRLDKETTGVLLIAKNDEAYRHASLQFEHRTVKKIYHALVSGTKIFINEKTELPLLLTGRGFVKVDQRKGKESTTIINTIKNYRHFGLVECELATGRKHQIRVHLSHLGFPIVGDNHYGGQFYSLAQIKKKYNPKSGGIETPLISRMALHAQKLTFQDMSEVSHTIEAPYPNDIKVMLKILEKYDV